MSVVELDPDQPLIEQVDAGLEACLGYFVANRHTVPAANRGPAEDPSIGRGAQVT